MTLLCFSFCFEDAAVVACFLAAAVPAACAWKIQDAAAGGAILLVVVVRAVKI